MDISKLSIQIADPAGKAINNFIEHLKFEGLTLSKLEQKLIFDLHNLENKKGIGKLLLIIMFNSGKNICNLLSPSELEHQAPWFIPFLYYCELITSVPKKRGWYYEITQLGIDVLKQNGLID